MPTPIFTIRLSPKVQGDLRDLGAIYGAPNARAFAREILEVITSGEIERIKAFNQRLITRMGQQLVLKLNEVVDTQQKGDAPRKTRKTRITRRRGRRGRSA